MTRTELENQLLALTSSEKAEIIQSPIETISIGSHGIAKTLGVCGGEACIAGTRITVWLLALFNHSLQRISITIAVKGFT